MKRAVIISEVKTVNGVMAEAIKKTGIDVFGFEDLKKIKDYDQIIIFYNRAVPFFETKAQVAWWQCDLRHPNKVGMFDTSHIDLIFMAHKNYWADYMEHYGKAIYYMPQHGLDYPLKRGRDIDFESVFLGNFANQKYHGDRKEILDYISNYTDLKIISREKDTKDQNWIYNKAKFSLSISYPMIGGTSNRLYNILSSNGFALVRHFPGIEKLFQNHRHLVWWKEKEEIPKILDHYRKKIMEYEFVRNSGYDYYNKKHTASHRLQNMFDIMDGKTKSFYGYL